jgi:prepilin-type N-terminal cleavage/methylation domain-containing protein
MMTTCPAPLARTDGRTTARSAFTLIELMVAVALMVMLLAILAQLFGSSSELFRQGVARVDVLGNSRMLMDMVEKEINSLSDKVDATDSFVINSVASSSGTFLTFTAVTSFIAGGHKTEMARISYKLASLTPAKIDSTGAELFVVEKDITPTSGGSTMTSEVCSYVKTIKAEYWDKTSESWKEATSTKIFTAIYTPGAVAGDVPLAIRLTVQFCDERSIEHRTVERVLLVPTASPLKS